MRYDAFISYSHQADRRFAPVFQRALERIGLPWWRRTDLRVFRDDASLPASAALWRTIEAALAESRHLILFASPAAAASSWVDQEVQWWLRNRSADTLLIVVTAGNIVFNRTAQDFDWSITDCLPPALKRRYVHEPFWTDMRFAAAPNALGLREPRFRSAALGVAAAVRGVTKDALETFDARAHRRALAYSAGTLAALGFLAGIGFLAARSASKDAELKDLESHSRRLAAEALVELARGSGVEAATIKAALAWRLSPTDDARRALIRIDETTPDVTRVLGQHRAYGVRRMLFSPDASRLLTVGEDGAVLQWAVADGRLAGAPLVSEPQNVRSMQFSRDASHLLLFGDSFKHEMFLNVFRVRDGERLSLSQQLRAAWPGDRGGDYASCAAISPSGARVVVAGRKTLVAFETASGRASVHRLPENGWLNGVGFADDDRVIFTTRQDGAVWASRLDVVKSTLQRGAKLGDAWMLPQWCGDTAFAAGAGRFAFADQRMSLLDVDYTLRLTRKTLPEGLSFTHGDVNAELDTAGERLAWGHDGIVYVWDAAQGKLAKQTPRRRDGSGVPVALSRDGRLVASLGDRGTPMIWTVNDEAAPQTLEGTTCGSYGREDECIRRLCERVTAAMDPQRIRELLGPSYMRLAPALRDNACASSGQNPMTSGAR